MRRPQAEGHEGEPRGAEADRNADALLAGAAQVAAGGAVLHKQGVDCTEGRCPLATANAPMALGL